MVRRIRRPLKTVQVKEVAGPERIIYRDRPVEVVKEVEKVVYRDHPAAAMLDQLEATKAKIDERPADPLDTPEEPPEAIADLFDPELTARQNQEALQKKYAQEMSEHYRLLDYGDQDSKSKAQIHLDKAQRLESGIKWNRARLAEVV